MVNLHAIPGPVDQRGWIDEFILSSQAYMTRYPAVRDVLRAEDIYEARERMERPLFGTRTLSYYDALHEYQRAERHLAEARDTLYRVQTRWTPPPFIRYDNQRVAGVPDLAHDGVD